MSILKEIVTSKKEEILQRKRTHTLSSFESLSSFHKQCPSLKEYLLHPDGLGIIAEFKRKSPSKGAINTKANLQEVVVGYEQSGVSAISVLTESKYFDGNDSDLQTAKNCTSVPVLRKDFVVDIFQIAEAKAIGADAILLIAEILEKEQLDEYLNFAHSIGLEALIEVHGEKDLHKLPKSAQIVGINGRNLNTFNVSLNHTTAMLKQLPSGIVTVAESGISSVDDYLMLRQVGFNAFLIGEYFMKHQQPGAACHQFTASIKAAFSGEFKK